MSQIKNIGIRIPEEALKKLHHISKHNGRSANRQVVYLIQKCIREFEEENGNIDWMDTDA